MRSKISGGTMRSPIAMHTSGSASSSSGFATASSAAHAVPPVGFPLRRYRLPLPRPRMTSSAR